MSNIWRGRDSWDGCDELLGLRGIVKLPGLKGDTGALCGTKGDGAGGVVFVCRGFDFSTQIVYTGRAGVL